MPKGYSDGRAATSVYINPGNQTGIDLSKLIIKGKKTDFRQMYTLLAPEQYVVSGLDEIDYSKEGEYRVEYRVKVSDEKELTLVITVYVSEKNSDIMVKAGKGGQFYIEEKYDVYTEKQLIFTDKDQKYSVTAVPDRDFEFGGWYVWYAGGVLGDLLSENATYEIGMSDYDLNIIAMFKIKPEKSNLKTDVYQLHHWVGESGLPRVYRKGEMPLEAQNVLYYKPGTPETDFLKLDERGLRRKDNPTDNNVYEHVKLFFGDYSIDYGGLDFNKEGVYYMKYTLHFSRINKAMEDEVYNAFYVYVSERFAHLTVELTGKGSIAEKNNEFSDISIVDAEQGIAVWTATPSATFKGVTITKSKIYISTSGFARVESISNVAGIKIYNAELSILDSDVYIESRSCISGSGEPTNLVFIKGASVVRLINPHENNRYVLNAYVSTFELSKQTFFCLFCADTISMTNLDCITFRVVITILKSVDSFRQTV